MIRTTHYKIDYLLHDQSKCFYIFCADMNEAIAWHMAAADAGYAELPKFRRRSTSIMSRFHAEQHGISSVTWKAA
ncbi:DUF6555 family protein [Pseudomonas syringae]|uniref:DUF6555 family protein n=1 Tax=Pseudomonas syringae TaxID=317 RepID=UPI003AF1BC3A